MYFLFLIIKNSWYMSVIPHYIKHCLFSFEVKIKNCFFKQPMYSFTNAKHGFCWSSPTIFSDCPKNLLILTANISHSGKLILSHVHGYSDGIIDTTRINKLPLVKWPLMTILYHDIKVVLPYCLIMLLVLYKSIMPYHSAWITYFYMFHIYTVLFKCSVS
jgi:hypothetical protein